MKILMLDHTGLPKKWISVEKAIFYHAKELVAWEIGDKVSTYHGGLRGEIMSTLSTSSIIAIKNRSDSKYKPIERIILSNQSLFNRDHNMCGYCANVYNTAYLSRDHVLPRFLGGKDNWLNTVTCCKTCNGIKGHKTLKELGWKLVYVPYEPNLYEAMILKNRNILSDQMEFLLAKVPKESRVHEKLLLTA